MHSYKNYTVFFVLFIYITFEQTTKKKVSKFEIFYILKILSYKIALFSNLNRTGVI